MKSKMLTGEFITSFGRRVGRRLGKEKQDLIKTLLPQMMIDFDNFSSYELYQEKWLEIGFGYGEKIQAHADSYPDILQLGAEPFMNGVGELLKRIHANSFTNNIKLWPDDARILLERLPDNFLDKIFILFPDPWQKKRHNKRRIVTSEMLDIYSRKLKVGGQLMIATDHKEYGNWVKTRYQEKSRSGNNKHLFLIYKCAKKVNL